MHTLLSSTLNPICLFTPLQFSSQKLFLDIKMGESICPPLKPPTQSYANIITQSLYRPEEALTVPGGYGFQNL
jgi:hypothetical protein